MKNEVKPAWAYLASALLIALFLVIADQASKVIIASFLKQTPGRTYSVIPGCFSLTYSINKGSAWGIWQNGTLYLVFFALLVLAGMLIWHKNFDLKKPLNCLSFGLLYGGIAGNTIDRIRLGYVVDFLDVYIKDYHWPNFNLADSAICFACIFYAFSTFLLKPDVRQK